MRLFSISRFVNRLALMAAICLALFVPSTLHAYYGTVVGWGDNSSGQTNVPPGLTNCQAIAASTRFNLAVKGDGSVVLLGNDLPSFLNPPATAVNAVAVAAGVNHAMALKANSTVVAWGSDDSGQATVPSWLSNVTAIAAGDYHNLVLVKQNNVGYLYCWGAIKTYPNINAIAIAAGANHCLAIDSSGLVYGWGNNFYGQAQPPARLQNGTSVAVAVAAGESHSLALLSDGTVVGWGNTNYGKINTAGLSNVRAIAARGNHSLALLNNGTVVAWGANSFGESFVPRGLTNVVSITAGGQHSLAIYLTPVTITAQIQSSTNVVGSSITYSAQGRGSDPITYQWLFNGGEIANATNTAYTLNNIQPANAGAYSVRVTNPLGSVYSGAAILTVWQGPKITTQPQSLAVAQTKNAAFTVAGTGSPNPTYQWRKNGLNIPDATATTLTILGAQATDAADYTAVVSNPAGAVTSVVATLTVYLPPTVSSPPQAQTVGVGQSVTFTVTATGAGPITYQWRKNNIPIPDATNSFYTIDSAQMTNAGFYAVAVGNLGGSILTGAAELTVVAVPATFNVVGWGGETNMWNGTSYEDIAVPPGLSNILAVAAGGFHSMVLKRDGSILGWGDNRYGQAASPGGAFKAIAAGLSHSVGLRSNGTVVAWGQNTLNQTNVTPGLSGVVSIACGANFSLALKNTGVMVAWGDGSPPPPAGLNNNIRAIAAGSQHSLALKSNGTVVAWGSNTDGQTRIPNNLSNVIAVAAGDGHCLALLTNGAVVGWGRHNLGQTNAPAGMGKAIAIAAGGDFSMAILQDNTVVCWGDDNYGQTETPAGLEGVYAISAGPSRALVARLRMTQISNLQRRPDGVIQFWLGNRDGMAMDAARLNQFEVYATSDARLPLTAWDQISPFIYLVAPGAYLQVVDNTAPQWSGRYYRVLERP